MIEELLKQLKQLCNKILFGSKSMIEFYEIYTKKSKYRKEDDIKFAKNHKNNYWRLQKY